MGTMFHCKGRERNGCGRLRVLSYASREDSNFAASCDQAKCGAVAPILLDRGGFVAQQTVSAPGGCQTAFVSPGGCLTPRLPQQRFSSPGKAGNHPLWEDRGRHAENRVRSTRFSKARRRHTLNLSEARPRRASRAGRREMASRLRVSEDSGDRRQSFLLLPRPTMSALCPR